MDACISRSRNSYPRSSYRSSSCTKSRFEAMRWRDVMKPIRTTRKLVKFDEITPHNIYTFCHKHTNKPPCPPSHPPPLPPRRHLFITFSRTTVQSPTKTMKSNAWFISIPKRLRNESNAKRARFCADWTRSCRRFLRARTMKTKKKKKTTTKKRRMKRRRRKRKDRRRLIRPSSARKREGNFTAR